MNTSTENKFDTFALNQKNMDEEKKKLEELTQGALDRMGQDQKIALERPSILESYANKVISAKRLMNGDNFIGMERRANAAYYAELGVLNGRFKDM